MVKVQETPGGEQLPCEIYLDGYLKQNLDHLHEYTERDWDNVCLVVGYEGCGKSTFTMQPCLYLDTTFSINNVVFTPEQFEDAVDNAPPQSAIQWDESDAITGHHASKKIQLLKSKMKRIRKKNLHIFMITPTFFDMNKYFVMHRPRLLIHVYADGYERGYFRFFNKDQLRELYLNGKKEWNMYAANPNFRGRFTDLPDDFAVDFESYEEKKDTATEKMLDEDESMSKQEIIAEYRRGCWDRLDKKLESKFEETLTHKEYGHVFDCSSKTIQRDKKKV